MKRFAIYLSIVTIAICFTACKCSTKTYDCPGFNSPELTGWFPYGNTAQLIFQNNSAQRDTINLKNLETSPPYTMTGTSRSCTARKTFESIERSTTGAVKMSVMLEKFENINNPYTSAIITIGAYIPIEFQKVNSAELGTGRYNYSMPMTIQYLPSLTIGGKTFTNSAIASRDTVANKSPGVYKIYLAKNQGVVGYEELPSRSLWVLQ